MLSKPSSAEAAAFAMTQYLPMVSTAVYLEVYLLGLSRTASAS